MKGGLYYFAKRLKLRHYNANAVCDLCPANRDPGNRCNLYNNLSADASWMRNLYTEAQRRALYVGRCLHWRSTLVGVCHHCIEPDELHVWHIGAAQYFMGSVLYLLAFEILDGRPEENMGVVWKYIFKYYAANAVAVQYTNLSVASFSTKTATDKHFPCLKGRGAKQRTCLLHWPKHGGHWRQPIVTIVVYVICWMVWWKCRI